MMLFQSILGLLLSAQVATAFTANSGLARPTIVIETQQTLSTPFVHEHSTSLHLGISYGPPLDDHAGRNNVLLRRKNRFAANSDDTVPSFYVDPAFTAISIAYNVPKQQEETLQRRRVTRAIAASTAVVCATFMAQQLAASGIVPYFLSKLPHFYQAYPLQASMVTCGLNSVMADSIAQIQSWKPKQGMFGFEWNQTFSSLFYGTICLGIGSNLAYTKLLPMLLAGTSGLTTVLGSALFDNAVLAPLLWLPPAYAIKAWFKGESVKAALKGYVHAVKKEKLLHRYASFWFPASMISFGFVPKHLRVVSTTAFSFVWFLILTSITSKNKK